MATGLPPSWEVRHSNSKNLPYYFNTANKESRWEPPTGTDAALLKSYMAAHHSSTLPPHQPHAVTATAASSSSTRSASSKQAADGGEKIRAAHLLVKHNGSRRPSSWKEENITRTKGEALEMLRGYERRIKEGGEELGELAKSESDCSSARKKGDLGFFGRGDMQKEFEEAAFALEPGEITGPVDTASGVHLIERLQ